MFTLWGPGRGRSCDGVTRRNFLAVGSLTLGGLSLADLLARGDVTDVLNNAGAQDVNSAFMRLTGAQSGSLSP